MRRTIACLAGLYVVLPAAPWELNAQGHCSQCTPCQRWANYKAVCNTAHINRVSDAKKARDEAYKKCDKKYKRGSEGHGICRGIVVAAYAFAYGKSIG